jgi:regulator of nucleoside diphosphate kinase
LVVTHADFANLSLLALQHPLQRLLERAVVVSSDAVPPGLVTMNSQVAVRDETSGERRVLSIVYPTDADPASGRISVLEPIGTALLGAFPGQSIEYAAADGKRRLRVEDVVHQPERSLRTHLFIRNST